jgi:nucleotide-binding universal stress UspA family protein
MLLDAVRADDRIRRLETAMESMNELVMEPASKLEAIHASPTDAIKSILFHVHEDDGLDARLQVALSLARACSAHLHLLHVVPVEAYTVVDLYGGSFASGEIVEVLETEADKLRRRLEEHVKLEDVTWDYEDTTSPTTPTLLRAAALSDLVFIGRAPAFHEFSRTGPSLLGELVCSTRSPLCVPADGVTTFDPFGKAVIAWNGGIEAANAVRGAIGLLKMASEVRVVRYAEDKDVAFPDTRVVEYLSRHGVSAVLDLRPVRRDFADDLVEYAGVYSAEYLVMGGYSHSRAGEFLFGGVTRTLLRACPVTLVMAH